MYRDLWRFSVTTNPIGIATPKEVYIPLWWNTKANETSTSTSAGISFLFRTTTNAKNLHTLSSNWNPNTIFAFEAFLYSASTPTTVYAALWDITSNQVVSGSQISTTSGNSTATILRSGTFKLVPGHTYGVTFWSSVSNVNSVISDASIVAIP